MFHGLQAEKDNPIIDGNYWKQRALEAEKKLEILELAASYAQDVVDFWPIMTLRTIRVMIPKMENLKQALAFARK